jgi:DNA modification methylase
VPDHVYEFDAVVGPAVSRIGDLWLLNDHRMYCGSALDPTAYDTLLGTEKAAAVFTDPPYNVKVDGHVCGSGGVASSGEGDSFERRFATATRAARRRRS